MSVAKTCYSGTRKDKSSFAMTCNRLSSFLREKGSLKDIGINAPFDVIGKPSLATETNKTTVDLLSKIESPVSMSVKMDKSINHLPQYVTVDSFCRPDDSTNKAVSDELVEATESKTAQMTILYRGQVLVFDSISANKAKEIMLAAGASSSSSFDNQIQNKIPLASTSTSTLNSPSEGGQSQCRVLYGVKLNGLDLPIARRSSLHKFLAKRKDRASERAPYQLPNRLMTAPSSNHKFDLNLEISL